MNLAAELQRVAQRYERERLNTASQHRTRVQLSDRQRRVAEDKLATVRAELAAVRTEKAAAEESLSTVSPTHAWASAHAWLAVGGGSFCGVTGLLTRPARSSCRHSRNARTCRAA